MQRNYLADFLKVLAGTSVARGFALLNALFIARSLGPDVFGQFSIFYAFLIFTWHSSQGFDITYIRHAVRSKSEEDKIAFLKAALFWKTAYTVLLIAIGIGTSEIVAEHFYGKKDLALVLRYSFLAGGFLVYLRTVGSIFQAQEKYGLFSGLGTLFSGSIFLILIVGYLLKLSFDLELILRIYLLSGFVIGSLSLAFLAHFVKGPIFSARHLPFASVLEMGKWVVGITMLNYIFEKVDLIVLTRFGNYAEIGVYSAAVHMVTIIMLVVNAVSQVFLPKSMRATESPETLRVFSKQSLLLILVINSFVLFLMGFAPFLLRALYGAQYVAATTPLRILLSGVFIINFYRPFSFLFYAMEEAKSRFWLELSGVLIGAALLFVLVPIATLAGASGSKAIALIAVAGISSLILRNRLKQKFQIKTDEISNRRKSYI